MLTESGHRNAWARRLAPFVFLVGIIGWLVAVFVPRFEKSAFELGILYAATRYDQALALIGISLAMALLPWRLGMLTLALFVGSVLAGGVISGALTAALSTHPLLIGYVFLIGPIACVFAGAALAAPRAARLWLLIPAVIVCGVALGLVMSFKDSTLRQWAYSGGAVAAGLWLVVAPMLVVRAFEQPWFAVPARILGSWLIAIGAILLAAQLIPRPEPPEPPIVETPAEPGTALSSEPLGAPTGVPQPNLLGLPGDVQ